MSVGIVIGRFQTYYLHEGHVELINTAQKNSSVLLIFVGCSSFQNKRNPLDFETRRRMLQSSYSDALILPLYDQPSDENWSKTLDTIVDKLFPHQEKVLYHSRDSFRSHYYGAITCKEVEEVKGTNATDIRKICAANILDNDEFRMGIIYGVANQFDRVNPTVDIVCYRLTQNGYEILFGIKKPPRGIGKLQLLGGFVDGKDTTPAYTVVRELFEEAKILVSSLLVSKPIFQGFVNDWRITEDNTILTTLYSVNVTGVGYTEKAGDDIDELVWVNIQGLLDKENPNNDFFERNNIAQNHIPLVLEFVNLLKEDTK